MNSDKRNQILAIFIAFLLLSIMYAGSILHNERPARVFADEFFESFMPVIWGENDNVPSPTATSSNPPTSTPTMTYTPTSTNTATPTVTATVTETPTITYTPTPTETLTATITITATMTSTATFTPSPTMTPTPTMTPSPTATPSTPDITSFTADNMTISAGGSTYLRWTIDSNVDSLELDPIGPLPVDVRKYHVSPSQNTLYTLHVGNSNGNDSSEVILNVVENQELLVYHWNKELLKKNKGFGFIQPPQANGNWVDPVNFAGGTMHIRAEIFSMPVIQDMRLQFCFWQLPDLSAENCGSQKRISTKAGIVVEWEDDMTDLWMKNGPIDWTQPRVKYGAVVRNSDGQNVSDYHEWEWNGENPDEWYPLDMHFKVVLVAEGAEFSGWSNYAAK
jgi:hypothetical protein